MKLSSILFFCLGIFFTFSILALGFFMIFAAPNLYSYIAGFFALSGPAIIALQVLAPLLGQSEGESKIEQFIANSKPLYYFMRGVGASFLLMVVGVFGSLIFGLLYFK